MYNECYLYFVLVVENVCVAVSQLVFSASQSHSSLFHGHW